MPSLIHVRLHSQYIDNQRGYTILQDFGIDREVGEHNWFRNRSVSITQSLAASSVADIFQAPRSNHRLDS